MYRRPPRSTRTDTLFPYTTLFRSSLKARAVGFLSRREHSRLELERKLAPYAADAAELERVLDQLEREQWLSNQRFAQALVNRRAQRQGLRVSCRNSGSMAWPTSKSPTCAPNCQPPKFSAPARTGTQTHNTRPPPPG